MAPWKCPDCGVWWSGIEHRCAEGVHRVDTNPPWWNPYSGNTTWTVRCTCAQKWKSTVSEGITCPVHDVLVTYTY
jgi:hypothetical protein